MNGAKQNSLSLSFQKIFGSAFMLLFCCGRKLQVLFLLALGCCSGTQLKGQHAIGLHGGVFKPGNSSGMQSGVALDYTYKASDKVFIGIGAAHYANSNSRSTRLNGICTYTLKEGVFSPYAGADMGLYFIEGFSFRRIYESTNYIGLASLVGAHYQLSEVLALNVQVKYPLMLTIDQGGKGLFPIEGLTALECNVGAIVFF